MNEAPKLPDDDTILSHWDCGHDTLEIARIFHVPEVYIYSRLHRLREARNAEQRKT